MSSFTVVIPTRNRLGLLKQCLASVFAATSTNTPVIVIDDCSEDETTAWVSAQNYPALTIIRLAKNSERSVARNAGLELVTTPYVLFFDDDDLLLPGTVQKLVDALEQKPKAVAAVFNKTYLFESGLIRSGDFPRKARLYDFCNDLLMGSTPFTGQILFRTDLVRKVGGWKPDLSYAEDYDLFCRIAPLGVVALVPVVGYLYRIHGQQARPRARWDKRLAICQVHRANLMRALPRKRQHAYEAHCLFVEALKSYDDKVYKKALWFYTRTIWAMPAILATAFVGKGLRRNFIVTAASCLLSPRLKEALRQRFRGTNLYKARGVPAPKPLIIAVVLILGVLGI